MENIISNEVPENQKASQPGKQVGDLQNFSITLLPQVQSSSLISISVVDHLLQSTRLLCYIEQE